MTLRVVYMGTPDFAVPALEALCQCSKVDVTLVVSQPDRTAGRGKRVQRTPVAATADKYSIPTFQPESLRDNEEALEKLRAENADIFVVAAYGQILRQNILDLPTFGCFNLHASLLPRWRGAAPIQWAVASGDGVTGISLMRMERGLDTGPVHATNTTIIREEETAGELHDRLALMSGQLLLDNLDRIVAADPHPEKQNDDRSTYARMLTVDDRRVDMSQTAQHVAWHINGMAPWPGARVVVQGDTITLGRARLSTQSVPEGTRPGTTILASRKDGWHIATGDGRAVQIIEAQRPNKRMMATTDMLQGYDIPSGSNVEPFAP